MIPDTSASVPGLKKIPPEAAFSDEIATLPVQFMKRRGKKDKWKGEKVEMKYIRTHTHTRRDILNT